MELNLCGTCGAFVRSEWTTCRACKGPLGPSAHEAELRPQVTSEPSRAEPTIAPEPSVEPGAEDPSPELGHDLPSSEPEPAVEAEAGAEAEVEPEVEPEVAVAVAAGAEAEVEPEVEPEVAVAVAVEPGAEAEAEAEVEPEVEAEAEPEVEPLAPEAEPEVEPEAAVEAEPEVEPEAEPDVEPAVEAEVEVAVAVEPLAPEDEVEVAVAVEPLAPEDEVAPSIEPSTEFAPPDPELADEPEPIDPDGEPMAIAAPEPMVQGPEPASHHQASPSPGSETDAEAGPSNQSPPVTELPSSPLEAPAPTASLPTPALGDDALAVDEPPSWMPRPPAATTWNVPQAWSGPEPSDMTEPSTATPREGDPLGSSPSQTIEAAMEPATPQLPTWMPRPNSQSAPTAPTWGGPAPTPAPGPPSFAPVTPTPFQPPSLQEHAGGGSDEWASSRLFDDPAEVEPSRAPVIFAGLGIAIVVVLTLAIGTVAVLGSPQDVPRTSVPTLPPPTSTTQAVNPHRFIEPLGRFVVDLPGSPSTSTSQLGAWARTTYTASTGTSVVAVSATSLPTGTDWARNDNVLRQALGADVAAAGGEVASQVTVLRDGHKELSATYTSAHGSTDVRIFVSKGTLFTMAVTSSGGGDPALFGDLVSSFQALG